MEIDVAIYFAWELLASNVCKPDSIHFTKQDVPGVLYPPGIETFLAHPVQLSGCVVGGNIEFLT